MSKNSIKNIPAAPCERIDGSISVKFIDDNSQAVSVDLKKCLAREEDQLDLPLTYQQRTGHKIKPTENMMQCSLDEFFDFTAKNGLHVNFKKSEVMVFNFSKKFAFPRNLTNGGSDLLSDITSAK